MSSILLPTPLLLVVLGAVLGVLLFVTIRSALQSRLVFPWQNDVAPMWSNISAHDFDQLRHHLRESKPRPMKIGKRQRTATIDETDHLEEVINDREDVVIIACRRHWIAGIGLIPAVALFIVSIALTIVLSQADMSNVISVPAWRLGLILVSASLIFGLWSWIEWRYVFYMLTNQAIHIIKQPPIWFAFWPGYRRRLPLGRVSLAGADESLLGNVLGYMTVEIGTNMTGKEDAPFNSMTYMPQEAEFDSRVNELVGV